MSRPRSYDFFRNLAMTFRILVITVLNLGAIALSKSAANEYGRHGIRVNSLCPGAIRTPLLEKKFTNASTEEAIQIEY